MASFALPSLKGRALRLLSIREHSRTELEQKLKRFEEDPGDLTKALDALQAKGFIDEQRVIESVLHRRAGKLGIARIKQELQGKGLDREAINAALAGLQASEYDRALAIWKYKFGVAPTDSQTTAKHLRFLAARGFDTDTIRRVVKAPAST